MWILVSTFVAFLVIESTLVGLALAAVSRRFHWTPSILLLGLVLTAVFAFLDTFYLPAVVVLNATLEIQNPDFATLIGPGSPIELSELLRVSITDPLWWVAECVLAAVIFRASVS